MKTITEFLSTKVAKTLKHGEFPDKPEKELIIEFLESQGFKELNTNKSRGLFITEFIDSLLTSKTPLYITGPESSLDPLSYWIRFGWPGNVSKDNPIFFCRYKIPTQTINYDYYNYSEDDGTAKFGSSKWNVKQYSTFEEFRNRVNEFFDA